MNENQLVFFFVFDQFKLSFSFKLSSTVSSSVSVSVQQFQAQLSFKLSFKLSSVSTLYCTVLDTQTRFCCLFVCPFFSDLVCLLVRYLCDSSCLLLTSTQLNSWVRYVLCCVVLCLCKCGE
jgi:hypothetical protein